MKSGNPGACCCRVFYALNVGPVYSFPFKNFAAHTLLPGLVGAIEVAPLCAPGCFDVDLSQKYLFGLLSPLAIFRINLDGTGQTTIVSHADVEAIVPFWEATSAICVDAINNNVYFSAQHYTAGGGPFPVIWRCDYNGGSLTPIFRQTPSPIPDPPPGVPYPYWIAGMVCDPAASKLFWSQWTAFDDGAGFSTSQTAIVAADLSASGASQIVPSTSYTPYILDCDNGTLFVIRGDGPLGVNSLTSGAGMYLTSYDYSGGSELDLLSIASLGTIYPFGMAADPITKTVIHSFWDATTSAQFSRISYSGEPKGYFSWSNYPSYTRVGR